MSDISQQRKKKKETHLNSSAATRFVFTAWELLHHRCLLLHVLHCTL